MTTLQIVKNMTAVGVPREQAEVIAESIIDAVDAKAATKGDLAQMEIRLTRGGIAALGVFAAIIVGSVTFIVATIIGG